MTKEIKLKEKINSETVKVVKPKVTVGDYEFQIRCIEFIFMNTQTKFEELKDAIDFFIKINSIEFTTIDFRRNQANKGALILNDKGLPTMDENGQYLMNIEQLEKSTNRNANLEFRFKKPSEQLFTKSFLEFVKDIEPIAYFINTYLSPDTV